MDKDNNIKIGTEDNDTMDNTVISIIVNIFVAMGTILLAYYAYLNIKVTQKQLKSFQKQTKIFLSQNQPNLFVERVCFRQNSLIIFLTNAGVRPAFEIGCAAICYRVNKVQEKKTMEWLYKFGWPKITKEDIKDFFDMDTNQELIVTEEELMEKTRFQVKPEPSITFLKRDNEETSLNSGERDVRFKCEPVFGFDNVSEKEKQLILRGGIIDKYKHWNFKFNDIKKFYKEMGVRYFHLEFSLWSKDPIENPIFYKDIISCIVDLDEDNSIEEAIPKPRKLIRYALSFPKFVKEIGWQPLWMYKEMKWRSHISEEDNRE